MARGRFGGATVMERMYPRVVESELRLCAACIYNFQGTSLRIYIEVLGSGNTTCIYMTLYIHWNARSWLGSLVGFAVKLMLLAEIEIHVLCSM